MKLIKTFILVLLVFSLAPAVEAQRHPSFRKQVNSPACRAFDSITASHIPLLTLPASLHGRLLPAIVDNSQNDYWPGIRDQYMFMSCQEYAGIAYTFGYEINRLRNQPGYYYENSYPTHYTWNFLNWGGNNGVNFLQAFDVVRQQGNMTMNDYGIDTTYGENGWPTGYDKYYRGMHNRIRQVYAIPINCEEGIITIKHWLYDHLDGSATGGIACFTTDSWTFYGMSKLPPGTPEEGKDVVIHWQPYPVHGLTIVGYNDSIRFDINNDGQFTNNIDINGDGIIDARDWEIGGFRLANSYGGWWSDGGFVYVLYSAMASNYMDGGIFNNRVFVLELDPDYEPLLTVKVKMDYNRRDRLKFLAGVSADTTSMVPENILEFPVFNHQGGELPMQGTYIGAPEGTDTIEFGLDVTPLLSHVASGQPAKFFFMTEEVDPDHQGHGSIHKVSFIRYAAPVEEYTSSQTMMPIRDDDVTTISATGTPVFDKVQITTDHLTPFTPGQPWSTMLQAAGGRHPYTWSVAETYEKEEVKDSLPWISTLKLQPLNEEQPYTAVHLPFSFPFYGKACDTIYINWFGFVSFDSQCVPYPYITDEMAMLKKYGIISPAYSQYYEYPVSDQYGVWIKTGQPYVTIRWRTSMMYGAVQSDINFGLRLFPDGHFTTFYGDLNNPNWAFSLYNGVSKGDELNWDLTAYNSDQGLTGKSFVFRPPLIPPGTMITKDGFLEIGEADSTTIYDIGVRVNDANNLTDIRHFDFSDGLSIKQELVSGDDNLLKFGQPASFRLILANLGTQTLLDPEIRLRTSDTVITITDSLKSVSSIGPGETMTVENAFSFSLGDQLPNGFPVNLILKAQSGSHSWQKPVSLRVSAPDLKIKNPQVVDGADNQLEPGEFADLIIPLSNQGSLVAENLEIRLESTDTLLTIASEPVQMISSFDARTEKEITYLIQVSRNTPWGHKVPLKVTLSGPAVVNSALEFQLQVGRKPVALAALSETSSSLAAMQEILDTLGVSYDVQPAMPFALEEYSSVFVLLGTGNSGSHVLSYEEGFYLANYLNNGGKLYMEGVGTWYSTNSTPVHPMFKYTWERLSYFSYTGVTGVSQTFTDSLVLSHHGPVNYSIYHFQPVEPAFISLENTDDTPKNLEVAYDGEDYKTIGTFVGFGYLVDSLYPAGKHSLMKRYLDFFGVNATGPYPLFHTVKTSVCLNKPVGFTDDSYPGIVSRQWEFPGGNPSVSSDPDPEVTYSSTGTYDVKLTVSDGINTRTLLKKNYIKVNTCTGISENDFAPRFKIYPNPVRGHLWIKTTEPAGNNLTVILYDLTGRIVYKKQFAGNSPGSIIQIDCMHLQKGIYIIHLLTKEFSQKEKIIID